MDEQKIEERLSRLEAEVHKILELLSPKSKSVETPLPKNTVQLQRRVT